jgi:hypothetical protein
MVAWIQARPGLRGEFEGVAGPQRDRDVIGVAGHAVGTERQHGVRLDVTHDGRDPIDGLFSIHLRERAVLVVEPGVLGDPQDGERPLELLFATIRQLFR